MTLVILDPEAEVDRPPEGKPLRTLETLAGQRVGFLWNRHTGTVSFWPMLEREVESRFRPSETHRLYKSSTWNPVPLSEIEDFVQHVDYVIAGVGA